MAFGFHRAGGAGRIYRIFKILFCQFPDETAKEKRVNRQDSIGDVGIYSQNNNLLTLNIKNNSVITNSESIRSEWWISQFWSIFQRFFFVPLRALRSSVSRFPQVYEYLWRPYGYIQVCISRAKDLSMSFHPPGFIVGSSLFNAFQIFRGRGCKKVFQKCIPFFFVHFFIAPMITSGFISIFKTKGSNLHSSH